MSLLPTLPETIVLRPKTDADDDFLLHAYETSRDEEFKEMIWEGETTREQFFRHQFQAQSLHFRDSYDTLDYDVIEMDGVPIGRLVLSWQDDHLHCVDIVLLPEYRRNRLGTTIMDAIVAEADRRGISASLYYEKWKPYLETFYNRYGFHTTKFLPAHCYMEREKSGSGF